MHCSLSSAEYDGGRLNRPQLFGRVLGVPVEKG